MMLLSSCGQEPSEAGKEAPLRAAVVDARDSTARDLRLTASAVISVSEFGERTGVDSVTLTELAGPVTSLDSVLTQLSLLHWEHDASHSSDERREIDQRAYLLHLQADAYEDQIDRRLTSEQHTRFHAYLAERAKAVGLPLDDAHGTGIGTAGNPHTIGHPEGTGHQPATPNKTQSPGVTRDSGRFRTP
jgi:hypothetical protein